MMLRSSILLLLAAPTATAFVVQQTLPLTTRLFAADNDILNSPAFLQRKFEVLQSDMQKAEEALAAAQQRLEEGKAEWGPPLADLQVEVRAN